MKDENLHEDSPAAAPPPAAPRAAMAKKSGRGLVWGLLAVPTLLGLGLLGGWWGLGSEPGSQWLLSQIPGLEIEAGQGRLLGDYRARRLRLRLPGGQDTVEIENLRWQGLRLAWSPAPSLWADVKMRSLSASRIQVHLAPSQQPASAPTDLQLPFGLQIDALAVDELLIPSLSAQALRGLRAEIDLGRQAGALHHLRLHALQWDRLRASGTLSLGSSAPLHLDAQLQLASLASPAPAPAAASAATQMQMQMQTQMPTQPPSPASTLPAWQASLNLNGPLQRLELRADLSAEAQRLQAQARLAPFAAWPLPALKLSTSKLDLAALLSGVPHTSLSGQLELQEGKDPTQALQIKAQLSNALAGRWNEQRLPVRGLQLALQARPGDPASLKIEALDLLLGSAAEPAGRLRALGQSRADEGSHLAIAVENLRSEGLDARLSQLQASGSVEISTQRSVEQLAAADPKLLKLQLRGDLQGRLLPSKADQRPAAVLTEVPLRLQALAQVSAAGLDLKDLRLQADKATLSAQGSLQLRSPGQLSGGWLAQAEAQALLPELRRFWPDAPAPAQAAGAAGAPLELKLKAELHSPARGGGGGGGQAGAAPGWLQLAPHGSAQLRLLPNQQAGLETAAELSYERADSGLPALRASVRAGSNQVQAQSSLDDSGQLLARVQLQLPQLRELQGLLPLAGQRLQGDVQGELSLQARQTKPSAGKPASAAPAGTSWRSQGDLQVRGLQITGPAPAKADPAGALSPGLQLSQGQLRWDLDSADSGAQSLRLELDRLSRGEQTLAKASASLQGSWARHRLQASAQLETTLPAGLLPPGQAPGPTRSQLDLSLQGALSQGPDLAWQQGAQWRASGMQLQARQMPGAAAGTAVATGSPTGSATTSTRAPWLNAQDLSLQLDLAAEAGLRALRVGAGRLKLLGAGLRWQQLDWQPAPAGGSAWQQGLGLLDLDLQLEPLAVAPLLARWQPDFGWGGDLQVDGHARIRSQPQLSVDLALERRSGDLSVTDDGGTQRLNLSELRLGLIGSPGLWHLTQALAGSNIGVLAGAVTARHDASSSPWPQADARLEGVLEARVDNLSTWGAWVPSGWRAGGSLFASASFAGYLNEPQVIGHAGGKDLVLRNPLLGIDVQGGEFALSLKGPHAELERFSVRAGAGELNASGSVQLGAKPRADFRFQADKFALLRRVDRRVAVNGQMRLLLDARSLDLQGQLEVDEGMLDFSRGNAPELDDDVQVLRQHKDKPASATASAQRQDIRVKLDIDLGRRLRLRGHGVDTGLRGNLQLSQQGQGRPQLHGTISTQNGNVDAYGQKLSIEKGLISFSGVLDNPRLDILALRPGEEDVRVGITVSGTALSPRIKLFSDPEMPDTAKLSWLLLGRAPDQLERSDTALLQKAAMALLAGGGESRTDKLIKTFGLDELSVSDSGDVARGTVVRLGKQLSRRWFIAFERGLNATNGSWQLIYRAAQRFTLRAQAGDENALDLIWQWKWE